MECHASLGGSFEEQQLLIGSVSSIGAALAPMHGDGMATLVRSGTPSNGSALYSNGFSNGTYAAPSAALPTHTAAGVPLASLVADGAATTGGEVADESFAEFATSVWPKLVD